MLRRNITRGSSDEAEEESANSAGFLRRRGTLMKRRVVAGGLVEHMLRPEVSDQDALQLLEHAIDSVRSKKSKRALFASEAENGTSLDALLSRLIDEAQRQLAVNGRFRLVEAIVPDGHILSSVALAARTLERGELTYRDIPEALTLTGLL